MRVRLILAGQLSESAGIQGLEVDVPAGSTVHTLLLWMCERHLLSHSSAFDCEGRFRQSPYILAILLNGRSVAEKNVETENLLDGDTVTLIPGIVGG